MDRPDFPTMEQVEKADSRATHAHNSFSRRGFEDLVSVTGRVRCQEKQTLMSIEAFVKANRFSLRNRERE
jgi:hypothetical protein